MTTVFSCVTTVAPAAWLFAGVTVSTVCSTTRFTVCATIGGAWSMRLTVTIPVAIEVTNETSSVSSTICDFDSRSMSIPASYHSQKRRKLVPGGYELGNWLSLIPLLKLSTFNGRTVNDDRDRNIT